MRKITVDRHVLSKATKKLDRVLEKLSSNNQAMRIVTYGDTLAIELFGYSATVARSRAENSYTGKICRCDAAGRVPFTGLTPVEVTWTARVVGGFSSPKPKSVNISIENPVRFISAGSGYSLGTDYINSSDNLLGDVASVLLRGCSESENGLWLLRNADTEDLLVSLVHTRHPMSRIVEILSNSFGLSKRVGRPLLLGFRSFDLN